MKKLAIAVAVILVLVIGALLALPAFIPVEEVKSQITAGARDATGRELTIDGPLSLSVFPRIEIEATESNRDYLRVKRDKMGHLLTLV